MYDGNSLLLVASSASISWNDTCHSTRNQVTLQQLLLTSDNGCNACSLSLQFIADSPMKSSFIVDFPSSKPLFLVDVPIIATPSDRIATLSFFGPLTSPPATTACSMVDRVATMCASAGDVATLREMWCFCEGEPGQKIGKWFHQQTCQFNYQNVNKIKKKMFDI